MQEHTRSRRRSCSVRIALATPEHLARYIAYQADMETAEATQRTTRCSYRRCTRASVLPPASSRAVRRRSRSSRSIHTAQAEPRQGTQRSEGKQTRWCTDRYTLPCTAGLASPSASDSPGRTHTQRMPSSRTARATPAPPLHCTPQDEDTATARTRWCTDHYRHRYTGASALALASDRSLHTRSRSMWIRTALTTPGLLGMADHPRTGMQSCSPHHMVPYYTGASVSPMESGPPARTRSRWRCSSRIAQVEWGTLRQADTPPVSCTNPHRERHCRVAEAWARRVSELALGIRKGEGHRRRSSHSSRIRLRRSPVRTGTARTDCPVHSSGRTRRRSVSGQEFQAHTCRCPRASGTARGHTQPRGTGHRAYRAGKLHMRHHKS